MVRTVVQNVSESGTAVAVATDWFGEFSCRDCEIEFERFENDVDGVSTKILGEYRVSIFLYP